MRMHPLHSLSHLAQKLPPILFASLAICGGRTRFATVVKGETSVNSVVDLSPLLESFEPLA